MTVEQELEHDLKKLNSFMTINEIRRKYDLPEIDEVGEVVENSIFYQAYNAKKQAEMQAKQQQQGGGGFGFIDDDGESEEPDYEEYDEEEPEEESEEDNEEEYNPFSSYDEEKEPEEESEEEKEEYKKSDSDNIFVKAFEEFLSKEEKENL